nr:hypothetical protein GTC16762_31420 [Pigmentibacter ruber]
MTRQLFKNTYIQLASYLSRKGISNPSPSTNLILNKFVLDQWNNIDGYHKVTSEDLKKFNIINISFDNWCINMFENSILLFKNIKNTEDFKNFKQKEYLIKYSNIISQYLNRAFDEYSKNSKGNIFSQENIVPNLSTFKIDPELCIYDNNYQKKHGKDIKQNIYKLNKNKESIQNKMNELKSQLKSLEDYLYAIHKEIEYNEFFDKNIIK